MVRGELPLAQQHYRKPRAQGTALADSIQKMLRSVALEAGDLACIAVAVGPGSFTGLRVGIAAARGLADGLGIPTFAYPSTLGWACAVRGHPEPVAVTLDARRGELYTALYDTSQPGRPQPMGDVRLESPESWADGLRESAPGGALLVGDGAILYSSLLRSELDESFRFAQPVPAGPDLSWVALDSARRLLEVGLQSEPLEPLYLRDHDGSQSRAASTGAIAVDSG